MNAGPTPGSSKQLEASSPSRPSFHRRDQASLVVRDDARGIETREERDDEEYIYVHPQQRSPSEASESLTVNFPIDDRAPQSTSSGGRPHAREAGRPAFYEYIEEDVEEIVESGQVLDDQEDRIEPSSLPRPVVTSEKAREKFSRRIREWEEGGQFRLEPDHRMASSDVDYSRQDFRRSRALIDEAARNPAPPPNTASIQPGTATEPRGKVKVRQVGDTTIVTEHRDPYSFYWQLDRVKKAEEPAPPRRLPPADYIIDEEVEEEEYDEGGDTIGPQQTVLSPDSHDSGINVERPESHYSRPLKEEPHKELPAGWEKHEDPSGFSYYWHVDSGTVQREPPRQQRPLPPKEIKVSVGEQTVALPPPPPPQPPIVEEHAFRQVTTKRCIENEDTSSDIGDSSTRLEPTQPPVRFMVRSLGCVEIPEEELTTERSSRAINEAIEEITADNRARSRRLGGGRELIMELDDSHLKLLDPDNQTSVVHSERIEHIRVWGVGRNNARDFAYVARDPHDRHRFLCYVFRCDNQARVLANALQEACNRRMVGGRRPTSLGGNSSLTRRRRVIRESPPILTPMDEPKKAFRCHFVGVTQVPRATGMHVLNEAVDRLVSHVGADRWVPARVLIAPSAIDIHELDGQLIAHCRVRYLSFLGIGRDIKCYVFHVEPNAGAMAKTVEAACKLRYQKVLDAHLNGGIPLSGQRQFTTSSNGAGAGDGGGTGVHGQFHSFFE